jgi:chemotaxis protein MotA
MAWRLLHRTASAGGASIRRHLKDPDMRKTSNPPPRPYARWPLAGAALGVTIVLSPIAFSTHGVLVCFSLAGLVIVVGGVIATAFMSFQPGDVQNALRAIPAMFRQPHGTPTDLTRDMNGILHWVHTIKRGGLAGLRASLDEASAKNPFVNYGLNMMLSEYRPEEVRAMMDTAADARYDRDCVPVDVLRAMTSHAPAFGMVGTLVGMIAMLYELNDNIVSTGSTLAVSFLSTLYGVVSARMIYMPAAARLQQEVDARQRRYSLIIEGMVMLARGETASHIQDRLNGFLQTDQHDYFDAIEASETSFLIPDPSAKSSGQPTIRHRPAEALAVVSP